MNGCYRFTLIFVFGFKQKKEFFRLEAPGGDSVSRVSRGAGSPSWKEAAGGPLGLQARSCTSKIPRGCYKTVFRLFSVSCRDSTHILSRSHNTTERCMTLSWGHRPYPEGSKRSEREAQINIPSSNVSN